MIVENLDDKLSLYANLKTWMGYLCELTPKERTTIHNVIRDSKEKVNEYRRYETEMEGWL